MASSLSSCGSGMQNRLVFLVKHCSSSQPTMQSIYLSYHTPDGVVFSSRNQSDMSIMTLIKTSVCTQTHRHTHTHTHTHTHVWMLGCASQSKGGICCSWGEPLRWGSYNYFSAHRALRGTEAYLDRILCQSHGPDAYLRRRNLLKNTRRKHVRCVESQATGIDTLFLTLDIISCSFAAK